MGTQVEVGSRRFVRLARSAGSGSGGGQVVEVRGPLRLQTSLCQGFSTGCNWASTTQSPHNFLRSIQHDDDEQRILAPGEKIDVAVQLHRCVRV